MSETETKESRTEAEAPPPVRRVVLDLEALGVAPGCVITQIGAVMLEGEAITGRIFLKIDPVDAQRRGLTIDAATVAWWMTQAAEARTAIGDRGALPLETALECFAQWMGAREADEIWGKGPSFDCAILAAAYRAIGREAPWRYSRERCVRTIQALAHLESLPEHEGVIHNALGDAEWEAACILACVRVIEGSREMEAEWKAMREDLAAAAASMGRELAGGAA